MMKTGWTQLRHWSRSHLTPNCAPRISGPRGSPTRCLPKHRLFSTCGPTSTPNPHRQPPKSILIVNKSRRQPVVKAIEKLYAHIQKKYPGVEIFHEDRPDTPAHQAKWRQGESAEKIDLIITLGGDGTILHASSLFNTGVVPPVLSFSMGTLGFLLPFHIDDYVKALESVFNGTYTILPRMRLSCTFGTEEATQTGKKGEGWQVMNEIALHRSSFPSLNVIDVYVDGQHLTEAVADGLVVSTPTGSTAYSLSAGGPILHPTMQALLLTPICPRSLSFRPLIFPATSTITMKIGRSSRSPAGTFMDGQETHLLEPGDSVTVTASPYPIPCINRSSIAEGRPHLDLGAQTGACAEDDFVKDINSLLQYNATFKSKALLKHDRSS